MHEVKIEDLKPGVFYLAKDKYHEKYHYQGTFVGIVNEGLCPFRLAEFKDTISCGIKLSKLLLIESGFVFYEKDAELNAYTNAVLREIIGDPNFFYFNYKYNFFVKNQMFWLNQKKKIGLKNIHHLSIYLF